MITVYGIKNCDTCRKALKWLDAENIEHEFHDFRADGLGEKTLSAWIKGVGWETLLNRRGTTWRKLPEVDRDTLTPDSAAVVALPLVPRLHIVGAFVILFMIPFTRLAHFLVAPLNYLVRPYQQVIWNWDRKKIRDPETAWSKARPSNN